MNPSLPVKPTSEPVGPLAAALRTGTRHCIGGGQKGQALMEFAIIIVILAVLVMGLADYGRLFVTRQMMVVASREGANLAARGTTLSNAVTAMVATAPAMLFANGYGTIIASAVTSNNGGVVTVTGQVKYGATNYASRIGNLNATGNAVALPSTQLPGTNQTLYITEVYYPFAMVTPVGNLLNLLRGRGTNTPTISLLYDASFF